MIIDVTLIKVLVTWGVLILASMIIVAGDGAYCMDTVMDRICNACKVFLVISGVLIVIGILVIVWIYS